MYLEKVKNCTDISTDFVIRVAAATGLVAFTNRLCERASRSSASFFTRVSSTLAAAAFGQQLPSALGFLINNCFVFFCFLCPHHDAHLHKVFVAKFGNLGFHPALSDVHGDGVSLHGGGTFSGGGVGAGG